MLDPDRLLGGQGAMAAERFSLWFMGTGDLAFLGVFMLVVAAGVALVLWSRKRKPAPRAPEDQERPGELPSASPSRRSPAGEQRGPLGIPGEGGQGRGAGSSPSRRSPAGEQRGPLESVGEGGHPRGLGSASPVPGLLQRGSVAPVPPKETEKVAELEPKEQKPADVRELLVAGRTLSDGLEKTRSQGFVSRLSSLFKKEIDPHLEERVEEVLLTSDIGVKTAQKLLAGIKAELSRSQMKDTGAVWQYLRKEVGSIVSLAPAPSRTPEPGKPLVVAVIGVNGTGKTTSIGKLAARYVKAGRKVLLVAADTFRAAAGEQLEIWAGRVGAECFRGPEGQDPASVAFDGIQKAIAVGADVVMVDTAGRLHTRKNLLEELAKIIRVCGKALPGAPHETLLVLDATIGQNAVQQADIFRGQVGVDGIILSKLDGTAKGGVVIGICDALSLPVKFVGVGEKTEDLQPFSPSEFVDGLFGPNS